MRGCGKRLRICQNAARMVGGVRVTHLGLNGDQFEAAGRALLVDPYYDALRHRERRGFIHKAGGGLGHGSMDSDAANSGKRAPPGRSARSPRAARGLHAIEPGLDAAALATDADSFQSSCCFAALERKKNREYFSTARPGVQ
jgi:hypothetical protein